MLTSSLSIAQEKERYFYSGKPYGSEALYNPLSVIFNASYDIIQLDGHSREIFRFPFGSSAKNVFRNLSNPFSSISNFGWGNFLRHEVLPLDFRSSGAQWWPNYQLHLIGGGMTYVALEEWYEIHNVPSPALFAIGTTAVEHFLNEMVENGAYEGETVDPIADIYLFDVGGIILFSSDGVKNFFSRDLNLTDWSLQPTLAFPGATLQNAGQNFSVKWKFPFSERWHFFYYMGMNGLTGLSYKWEDGSALSVGAGLRAKERVVVDATTHQQTVDLVWNGGLFFDKENSLMASLFLGALTDNTVALNIYPGVLQFGNFSPGVWCTINRAGKLMLGVSTVWAPGIGVQFE